MSIEIPPHYSESLSFEQQLLFVLSQMKKASAGEIAAELMELQGVASGDGVADLTVHTENELEKLLAEQKVYVIKERHQKKRFQLGN